MYWMAAEIKKDDQIYIVPMEDNIDEYVENSNQQKRISVVPPYWQRDSQNDSAVKTRRTEDITNDSSIVLEDNTQEPDRCKALWAKSVSVDDYTVISGAKTSVGNYVVWNFTVETLDGSPIKFRKRYSEIDDLRAKLKYAYPHCGPSLPLLPPKSIISRFRPDFLEKRRQGLFYFLNCVLLNPEFSASPLLKDFLFNSGPK